MIIFINIIIVIIIATIVVAAGGEIDIDDDTDLSELNDRFIEIDDLIVAVAEITKRIRSIKDDNESDEEV